MLRSRSALFLLLVMITAHAGASPQDALAIRKSWQTDVDAWNKSRQGTKTTPAPDPASYAKLMWKAIGSSLDQEWTIEPASWLLLLTADLPTTTEGNVPATGFSAESAAIRQAILKHHIASPLVMPACMALASSSDPLNISILEKIQSQNPNPKIQGVAALAAAIALKNLGDDPELMRKRLTYLRKAIIDSAEVELGNTTVANLAENELYLIRYLSKGRVAPDLTGIDSAGKPFKLSDYQGKVIVLVFWSSSIPQVERTLEITNAMVKKFTNKPIVVIGVNHDPTPTLKALESDGRTTWRNFSDPDALISKEFRVNCWPLVYVLDGNRQIQYSGSQGTFVEITAEALSLGK